MSEAEERDGVALTNLDEGDLDGALAIYEQHIKPAGRPLPTRCHGSDCPWPTSSSGIW